MTILLEYFASTIVKTQYEMYNYGLQVSVRLAVFTNTCEAFFGLYHELSSLE